MRFNFANNHSTERCPFNVNFVCISYEFYMKFYIKNINTHSRKLGIFNSIIISYFFGAVYFILEKMFTKSQTHFCSEFRKTTFSSHFFV